MIERKFSEILILIVGCCLSFFWAKTIAGGGLFVAVVPAILLVSIVLVFKFQQYLPAIVFGMIWYVGGSPFLKTVPYAFYFMAAAIGIAVLDFIFRRTPDRTLIKFVSFPGLISLACLAGIVGIYLTLTLLKQMGILPVFQYGTAGGLRVGLKFLMMLLFMVALFYGNMPTQKLNIIPKVAFVVGVICLALDAINFINPQTAFITYYFTTGINFEVLEYLRGSSDSVMRLGALRFFGFFMVLYVIDKFMRGRNVEGGVGKQGLGFKSLLIIGIGGVIILMGGYRNFLVRYVVVLLVFFFCYDRRWLVAMVLGALSLWGGAVSLGSSIEVFPLAVQRILGTLPGVYQTTVSMQAMGGFDMRSQLRMRFFDSEFWRHPWFGRGQVGQFNVVPESAYADHLLFFEVTQLWHSGLASTLDVVGVIGALLLIISQVLTFFYSIHLLRMFRARLEGWMIWSILFFYAYNIIFWYNGFFHREFPMMAISMVGVYLVGAMLKKEDQQVSSETRSSASLV